MRPFPRGAMACAPILISGMLALGVAQASAADVQSLRQGVASDTSHINALASHISVVQARLAPIQARLDAARAELVTLRAQRRADQRRLVGLQTRLALADAALTRLLVARYESDAPDAVTVILSAHGFADLLERLDFLKRVRNQDSQIISGDRRARTVVIAEATRLGQLQVRTEATTRQVLAETQALDRARLALVERQLAYERSRAAKAARLSVAEAAARRLQAQIARLGARRRSAGTSGSVSAGQVSSGGGFTFPMPKGAASAPGSWTQDQGVDISAPGGTPLLAVASGTIVAHGIGGFGPSAPVLHLDSGSYVYYGHAGPGNMVPIGTHVSAGQVVSEVGSGIVGISSGPHLEIGFCDASGTPAPGTSSTMLADMHAAYGG